MGVLRAALLLGLVFGAGCVQAAPRQARPALPAGFGAVMPDAPFAGYLYLSQERAPFFLEHTFDSADGDPFSVQLGVQAVSVWLGPLDAGTPPAIAARILFWRDEDARVAMGDLRQALHSADLWLKQDGAILYLVLGDDLGAAALREALDKERFVELSAARPRAWNTVLSLPPRPPQPVIGAGYVDVLAELLPLSFETLASQGGPDLRQVSGLVQRAGIGHVAFSIYGERLPTLRPGTSLRDMASSHLGAIAVADTAIPAPLLSVTFNLAGRQLGLERVRLREGHAYVYGNQELVTLTRSHAGSIYMAAAFSHGDARVLLERLGP